MFSNIIFYILSIVLVFSAIMVISVKSPVKSVLFMIVAFFALAGHYVLLNAQFLAVVNIIVYAGAIMVLFLFTVMFLNLNKSIEPKKPVLLKLAGVVAGGILVITMVGVLKNVDVQMVQNPQANQIGLVKNLGMVLYKDFMLPFEVSSVLFLTAIVSSLMLGKKEVDNG